MATTNSFNARTELAPGIVYYKLEALKHAGVAPNLDRMPFSIRVMLEALLRNEDGYIVTADDVRSLAKWNPKSPAQVELPFLPARVVMQDFTGVPAVVDLAAMRDAMKRLGGDPKKINPLVPVDLVIDHSVQVDFFGTQFALQRNSDLEFQRNRERYEFLAWGRKAFDNFRVVPPATGIVHQVNLEFLAQVVLLRNGVAFPDTVVGTDSHTTMINGLGVVGWGVGGIEAEAVMLGQPIYTLTPRVVGFKLFGKLREGVTATDLVLTCTQMLRKKSVVDQFVEFYGPGISVMSLPDRATIGNMAPDYGATMGFFPVDAETISYLRRTNREQAADLVEKYTKANGLFRTDDMPDPEFTDTLELDLNSVEPSVAGPKRPQDRVALSGLKESFAHSLSAPVKQNGFELPAEKMHSSGVVRNNGDSFELKHGSVVIAAITSCTNTSNPSVMLGAGLLAKKAVAKGLKVAPYVRTSLAPGSKVVTEYLREAGVLEPLNTLGFNVVAYGCTTCIGNFGTAAGRHCADHYRQPACRRLGAVGQPELRGPRQPVHAGKLSGVAAAGRGVRAGGERGYRSAARAARDRQRREAGLPERYLADPERSERCDGELGQGLAVRGTVRARVRQQRALERHRGAWKASCSNGTSTRPISRTRRSLKTPRSRYRRSGPSSARACWACSATA